MRLQGFHFDCSTQAIRDRHTARHQREGISDRNSARTDAAAGFLVDVKRSQKFVGIVVHVIVDVAHRAGLLSLLRRGQVFRNINPLLCSTQEEAGIQDRSKYREALDS